MHIIEELIHFVLINWHGSRRQICVEGRNPSSNRWIDLCKKNPEHHRTIKYAVQFVSVEVILRLSIIKDLSDALESEFLIHFLERS